MRAGLRAVRVGLFLLLTPLLAHAAQQDEPIALPDVFDIAVDASAKRAFHFGGYLKNETAYRFDEPRSFTKIRNILSLNMDYSLSRRLRFFASGWAYRDVVYDFFNYDTIVARQERARNDPLVFVENLEKKKDDQTAEFRELYLDLYLDAMDVRLGKQFIIWGVIEGIRIVDEINPLDFRELILLDLLDYRIPLWSVKASLYRGERTFEFLWIPQLQFHKPAPPGSEWELFQILDRTSRPEGFDPSHPKAFDPRFSEYGARMITTFADAEVSFSYFYTWDDYPTAFRVISNGGVQVLEPDEEPAILPTYTRLHIFGSTVVREVRGNIVRGELAYVKGKYFAVSEKDTDGDGILDDDGELERDHLRWALGYDFSLFGVDFAPSVAQWVIPEHDRYMLIDQFDTTFNLFLRKPMSKIAANFSLLAIYFVNFDELYARPRFTFNITDRFKVDAGMDVFMGQVTQFGRGRDDVDPSGGRDIEQRARFVGNFKDNRRLFVNFTYDF